MQREVLVVENDLTDAGLITHALREAIPVVQIQIACTTEEAYDFLFNTGTYSHRDQSVVPQLILASLSVMGTRGLELFKLL